MTMPSLINSTNKQELAAKYKKVYSSISQAYLMAQNDHGGSIEGLCNSNNDYITLFSKYMKNVDTCETNDEKPYCFTRSFKTLQGRVIETDGGATLSTPDGATLLFLHDRSSCDGTMELKKAIGCARVRVDINGVKMPNTVGYDIFDLYLTQNGVIPRGSIDTTVKEDEPNGWGRGITILTTGKINY